MRRAIILAGGKGTRLRPYTVVFPKPMLPIGGMPILEIILRQLSFYDFGKATLSLGYMPAIIQTYFEALESKKGLPSLNFYIELKALGTAGPVKAIAPEEENFLVMNGDVLSTLNLKALFDFHEANESALTLAVRHMEYQLPLGVIEFDDNGNLTAFREKPVVSYFDNLGIYIYSRRVLPYIADETRCDVNDLVNLLIEKGEKVTAYQSEDPYYWIDIGRHGDYEQANDEFDKISNHFTFLKNK